MDTYIQDIVNSLDTLCCTFFLDQFFLVRQRIKEVGRCKKLDFMVFKGDMHERYKNNEGVFLSLIYLSKFWDSPPVREFLDLQLQIKAYNWN